MTYKVKNIKDFTGRYIFRTIKLPHSLVFPVIFHYVKQGQVVCQYGIPPVCLDANYTKTLHRHHIRFFANIVGQILYLPSVNIRSFYL